MSLKKLNDLPIEVISIIANMLPLDTAFSLYSALYGNPAALSYINTELQLHPELENDLSPENICKTLSVRNALIYMEEARLYDKPGY